MRSRTGEAAEDARLDSDVASRRGCSVVSRYDYPVQQSYRRFFQEHFEKVLARLLEILVIGKTHLKIGRGITDTVMTDPAIAHVSPIFWGLTMTAHLDVTQLAAFKLFDKCNGTMTVEYLLKAAEQCTESFQSKSERNCQQ